MFTHNNVVYSEWERLYDVENGWSIVEGTCSRKQKILLAFGVKDSTSLIEFKIASGDIGLNWLVRESVFVSLGII